MRAAERSERGMIVAGAGVIGLGVAAVSALVASSENKDSKQHCTTVPGSPDSCGQQGFSERNNALTVADAATVALAAGAALLVTGGVLWLTAPRGSASNQTTAPAVAVVPTIGGATLKLKGVW